MLGGSDSTLADAPWDDPSWKLWGHTSARGKYRRPADLLFDLHPRELWSDPVKKHWDPTFTQWLRQNTIPIYMQKRWAAEAPASMEYPYRRVMAEWGAHPYFTNQLAWMIALALTEGVTHIGVYGCEYSTESEYGPQRGSAEFWCGVAIGRGVQVCLPPTCSLLREPRLAYGYESHPNGVRHASYSRKSFEKPKAERKDGTKVELILDPAQQPPLRPVLGPDGQPTGEPPALPKVF